MPVKTLSFSGIDPSSIADQFWQRLGDPDAKGCRRWKGHAKGYGSFRINGRFYQSNRIAYWLSTGKDPLGKEVCHTCDTPGCCEPRHLFEGTRKENAEDCVRKGRTASGDKNGSRTRPGSVPRGNKHWSRRCPEKLPYGDRNGSRKHPERLKRWEENPQAELTTPQVVEILRRGRKGETHQSIADSFERSRSLVSMIISGKRWKHLHAEGTA